MNRLKPSIIFWQGVEVKAALDEEMSCHWTTTAMSLLDSPVPVSLTSETKAIILVVAPSTTARVHCAASGLAHAVHSEEAPRHQTTMATLPLNALVPASLTSEIRAVLFGVLPRHAFVVQRLGWPTPPTIKERCTVKQQWQRRRLTHQS